jgi:ornithine cyclodeaminase
MVATIDVDTMRAWIRAAGIESRIAGIVDYLEHDFRRWQSFDKTARVASHSPHGVIELMPTSDGELYGFKYVNGHPSNPSRGLQTVTAFGVLADVDSGYPVLISEMTLLTALRTAATSAMAARALARPDSRVMALIGAGSQAEFQALGFKHIVGIDTIRVWDIDADAMATVARNLASTGLKVEIATGAADAVRGADIVTTCTADKAYATILTNEMVESGMHLNAIGGDCPGKTELDAAILHRASIFVEFEPQTRIEGEIQQLAPDHPVTPLWQVLTGELPGRSSDSEITVFDSVGFAIEDFSALRYVKDTAVGLASELDLIADPADPKDLFSLVEPATVRS